MTKRPMPESWSIPWDAQDIQLMHDGTYAKYWRKQAETREILEVVREMLEGGASIDYTARTLGLFENNRNRDKALEELLRTLERTSPHERVRANPRCEDVCFF